MADLFLHLPFARRLRLAEGLHPLIGESLARRPSLVALGATLPLLPGVERKGMSFFRRLFSGGSEAARWQKQLQASATPRSNLLTTYLRTTNDLGPMARLSLALGALSHELVEATLASVSSQLPAGERPAIERAQARLWLQACVPNTRDLEHEWRAVVDLGDGDLHRRTFEHIDTTLKSTFQAGPGRETLSRWARGLVAEVAPAAQSGLPPSLGLADHLARGPHFDQLNLIERLQEATAWFVTVANRLGEEAGKDDPLSVDGVARAMCDGGTDLVGASAEAPTPESWIAWYNSTRERTLDRGRNEKPAFGEGEEKPAAPRNPAFTGVMRLSDLPPEEVPPELQNPSLPPESAAAAPPMPAMTQEVSITQIEAQASQLPPLPLDASGPVPVSRPSTPPVLSQSFAAPAMTQEISVAQIEAEAEEFQSPAHTQEVSAVQIEAQSPEATPPTEPVAAEAPPEEPPRE